MAALERSLNRAWSALVDGHPGETLASLKRAAVLAPAAERAARSHD